MTPLDAIDEIPTPISPLKNSPVSPKKEAIDFTNITNFRRDSRKSFLAVANPDVDNDFKVTFN